MEKFEVDVQDWINLEVEIENIHDRLEKIEELLKISEWYLAEESEE